MAITTIDSYITVGNQFLNHWAQANAVIAPQAVDLSSGYTRSDFEDDLGRLENAIQAVIGSLNAQTTAAGDRDLAKTALSGRIAEFRAAVNYRLKGRGFERSVPRTPTFTDSEMKFIRPFDDVIQLWGRINGTAAFGDYVPPLVLPQNYTLVDLTSEVNALRALYKTVDGSVNQVGYERTTRDLLLGPLRARMLEYRNAIVARFGPDSALAKSLPHVTPRPGTTPVPVNLSGDWIAGANVARLTWTPSALAVGTYAVRYCPPPRYITKEEQSVLGDIPINDLSVDVTTGLAAPGAVAWFKVYVINETENEAGSNAFKITRPMS